MIAVNWIVRTLGIIFIGLFDCVAYTLVSLSYRIFLAVSELNLFGGQSGASQAIYDTFTQRIYLVLSVIMLFVFAYQLILLIANPDGDGTKKTTGLLKDLVISIALVVVLPVIFRYMTVFQNHVVKNNTIGAIVLGTAPTSSSTKESAYGDSIGMTVLMSFYHPQGAGYNTFFDTLGNLKDRDEAINACKEAGEGDDSQDTCELWMDALEEWNEKITEDRLDVPYAAVTWNLKIFDTLGEDNGTYYMWIISTGCALLVAWFFVSYAIDLGTRAVKLGFLELIAPIPVMLKIIPSMKKSFETWKGEIIKTYVELFIRLAVIFFVVKLCTLVPDFIEIIFSDSMQDVNGGILLKSATMVVLILGLLKFAKEAPELFKSIMDNGGGLFKNLDLKPGAKRRIESNEYAMKGLSTGAGAVSGIAASFAQRYRQAGHDADGNKLENASRIGKVLTALSAAPRGLITGTKAGFKNSSSDLKGIKNSARSAVNAAHESEQAAFDRDLRSAIRQTFRDNRDQEIMNSESALGVYASNTGKNAKEYINKKIEGFKTGNTRFQTNVADLKASLSGVTTTLSKESEDTLKELISILKSSKNLTKEKMDKALEPFNKAEADDLKKLASGQTLKRIIDGKEQEITLANQQLLKDYYKNLKNDAKAGVFDKSQVQVQAISTKLKEFEKISRSNKMDAESLNTINKTIEKKAKELFGNENIKNVQDLTKYASSSEALNNATNFTKVAEIMDQVEHTASDIQSSNEYLKASQSAKQSSKDSGKK